MVGGVPQPLLQGIRAFSGFAKRIHISAWCWRELALAALLAAFVSGCDPALERRYVTEGAGVDLYTADRANQIDLMRQYEAFICEQAGQPCDAVTFLEAGMNDIDQRCDGFLTWLDARRRDKEPVLAEINAISTAVHSIMTITGSSPESLEIVTAAFGLASATYNNWNSRLLIAVNQSTVQEVVYKSQGDYRKKIATFSIPDKPTAIYLLRNYLRLCMPITIEASINTVTTLVQRDAPAAARQHLVVQTTQPAMAVRQAFRESIPVGGAARPLPGVGGPPGGPTRPDLATGGKNDIELSMPRLQLQKIQAHLCVKQTGIFDSDTRDAIRQAKIGAVQSQELGHAPLFTNTDPDITSRLEAQIFADTTSCSRDSAGVSRGYLSAFEKFRFADAKAIIDLRHSLNLPSCKFALPDNGSFDSQMRKAIATVKGRASGAAQTTFGNLSAGALNDASYAFVLNQCV